MIILFSENLPDAISNDCAKCSDKQKEMTKKMLEFLIKKKHDWYEELETKYDPEGKYRDRFTKDD